MAENLDPSEVEELEAPRRTLAPGGQITPRITRDPLVAPAASSGLLKFVMGGVTGVALAVAAVLLVLGPADLLDSESPSQSTAAPAPEEAQVSPITSVPVNDALLTVRTTPRGATMTVDAEVVGSAPIQSLRLPAGERAIGVRLDGYAPVDTVVALTGGETRRLVLALTPLESAPAPEAREPAPDVEAEDVSAAAAVLTGLLDVQGSPEGAAVYVDGERVGATPLRGLKLPAGRHRISIQHGDFEAVAQTVDIRPGETTRLSPTLAARYGAARVIALPWGSISVDGEMLFEETDLRHAVRLPAGVHTFRAEHPVLGVIERKVRVLPDSEIDVILDLNQ